MDNLFWDNDGNAYIEDDVLQALLDVGAADCEVIFLHSDIMLGHISDGFKKRNYIASLARAVKRLRVRYIVVPTFTYSFCNGEKYDISKSRTFMGALNEFLRKEAGRYRTDDPLLSLSVPIELKERFSDLGNHSLGIGSGLDVLHHMQDVKFLFLGARFYDCFTYLHYIEKILDVPYRYDQPFTGTIIDEQGIQKRRTQYIHTACKGVKLREDTRFEDYLTEQGYLKKVPLGNSFVSCISETDAYREIVNAIEKDPLYFLAEPYSKEQLVKEYTYDASQGRITHC